LARELSKAFAHLGDKSWRYVLSIVTQLTHVKDQNGREVGV